MPYTTTFWGGAGAAVVPVGPEGVQSELLPLVCAYDADYYVPWAWRSDPDADPRAWLSQAARTQLQRHTSGLGPWSGGRAPRLASERSGPQYPLTDIDKVPDVPRTPTANGEALGPADELMLMARFGWWLNLDDGSEDEADRSARFSGYDISTLAAGLDRAMRTLNGARRHTSPLGRTRQGLDWLTPGLRRPDAAVLVVGDGLADHCAAMLLDRLTGPTRAAWAPTGFAENDGLGEGRGVLTWANTLWDTAPDELLITTVTGNIDVADAARRTLETPVSVVTIDDEPVAPSHGDMSTRVVNFAEVPLDGPWAELVDGQRLAQPTAVNFESGVSVDPLPIPPTPRIAEGLPTGTVRWMVDARIDGRTEPPRGALALPNPKGFEPPVRPGRAGWSWSALSGFISGAPVAPVHSMNRPALPEPSTRRTLVKLAEANGFTIGASNVDQFYNGAIARWGSLSAMATDLRDDARWAILQTLRESDEHEWCKNVPRPALRLSDIRSSSAHTLTIPDARALTQVWCPRGVIHRGFGLKCPSCRFAGFYRIPDIDERWVCERCRSQHDLDAGWPLQETPQPPFFYVLDEIVGQALDHHVEVPIFAVEAAERRSKRGFNAVLGLDVRDDDGVTLTDIDYAYVSDGRLTLGEAKSNGRTDTGEVDKFVDLARQMTVDAIEFATTESSWATPPSQLSSSVARWRPNLHQLVGDDL